jgi:selenide,water dikinase
METPANTSSIRLTQTVQKGGCAAKVSALELRKILSNVRFPARPSELLVDGAHFDDAAIYQVSEDMALVQTLDFFTPIVDSPVLFGKIACANALSDIYAMGGTPKTAMAILAFPSTTLEQRVISEVLQGACDVLSEAGVPLVGGHSIDDDTLKFGLSVTGFVHPKRIWSNANAKVGDVLLLTKALGTGTLTAALKRSEISEGQMAEAMHSMSQLNCVLDLLDGHLASGVHAATDITGFGLLGHAMQMSKASHKTFEIESSKLPRLPLAMDCLEKSFLTKAHRTNREYVEKDVHWGQVDELTKLLMFDPQTSGGLLLSVDPALAREIETSLRSRFSFVSRIGTVKPATSPTLTVV